MKRWVFFFTILTVAPTANAAETFYTNLSEDFLSCAVAKEIKASLQKEGKSWADKKKEISKRLKSFSDIEKAYGPDGPGLQGFANGIFIDRSGYLVQDAFIDPSLQKSLPKENWLGAHNYAAHVALSRSFSLKEPYDFVNDPNVVQKLKSYLESPERFSSPDMEVPYTEIEKVNLGLQDKIEVIGPGHTRTTVSTETVPQFPGLAEEVRKKAYAHFQEINTLASPLFIWLVGQPKESVGHAQIFQKALEIYGDPITALGVIAWIPAIECAMGPRRKKIALASSRLKPILYGVSDHAGTIYHFWGYVVRGLLGEPDGISMLRFRSKLFEGVIQKDGQDVTVDMFGLRVAEKITKFLDGDESICSQETLSRFPAIDDTLKKAVSLPATVKRSEHVDDSKVSNSR